MATDWSFSFAFDDDGDDSGDDHDASKNANASRLEVQQPLSEDSRLARDLDISTRVDLAVFNKNPWSIAKLNAATRSKQVIPSTKKALPQKSSQAYPGDKKTVLMTNPLPGVVKAEGDRAKTPVKPKQSFKAIGNAMEPVISPIKVRHEPQEQTLPVLQPKIKGVSVHMSTDTDAMSKPFQVDSNPHDSKPFARTSPLKRKRESSPDLLNQETRASSKPLVQDASPTASSPMQIRQKQLRSDDVKSGGQSHPLSLSKASAYNTDCFRRPDDEEWSTLNTKPKRPNKAPTSKLRITGGFKLPGVSLGNRNSARLSTPTAMKTTFLTIYQPPPPKIKQTNIRVSLPSGVLHSSNQIAHQRSAYARDFGVDTGGIMEESSGSSGGSDDMT